MHCLVSRGVVDATDEVHFSTQHHGVLTARGMEINKEQWFRLQFPAVPMSPSDDMYRNQLAAILNISPADIISIHRSVYDLIVIVTPRTFSTISKVQFSLIHDLPVMRGVIVTALGPRHTDAAYPLGDVPGEVDFVSRCFFSK